MDRMNNLSGILMRAVSEIPSLDKIFCPVSEEEFIKHASISRKTLKPKKECRECKTILVESCKYGYICTDCIHKNMCNIRESSSNIKILCKGFSADKTRTLEGYYSRGRFLPDIKFTEGYKLKIFEKEVQYKVYLPDEHPFTEYGAPMPDTFTPLMIDVYGAMHDNKPILGYFTANIMGNYFCSNFATGRNCISYSTGKTVSKLSDIAMSLVVKSKKEEKSRNMLTIKSKCQECTVFKHNVLSAYGIV